MKDYQYASYVFQISGFVVTFVIFILIKLVLRTNRTYRDFIIADDGAYSLSRLQALAWLYVIISFQAGVIICMLMSSGKGYGIEEFQLVFPEQILFLLGLSFSSYIVVKEISVKAILEKRADLTQEKGNWSDLIMGPNGLDLSRYQMLIWTILAVAVYIGHCHMFFYKLNEGNINLNRVNAAWLFLNTEERKVILSDSVKTMKIEIGNRREEEDIPTIAWSFIVLMGLSQGVYIGKKLIPADKINEEREKELKKLNSRKIGLEESIKLKTERSNLIVGTAPNDLKSKAELNASKQIDEEELKLLNTKIKALEDAINLKEGEQSSDKNVQKAELIKRKEKIESDIKLYTEILSLIDAGDQKAIDLKSRVELLTEELKKTDEEINKLG